MLPDCFRPECFRRSRFRPMRALGLTVVLLAGGCPRSDIGQPCNHGAIEAPQNPVVTFPALACDHLLCVYGEDLEVPSAECSSNAECNEADPIQRRFECSNGHCRIGDDYVLSRSMCSQLCESDADCEGGSDDTQCRTGFSCARVQRLDDLCCQKLCVCRDDLGTDRTLEEACEAGTQQGCCDQDPRPPGCGP